MKDTTIAVGLVKNVFEIAISREAGKVSKQLRVSRPKLVSFFAKQSAVTVLLEACVVTAAREGDSLAHEVSRMGKLERRPTSLFERSGVVRLVAH